MAKVNRTFTSETPNKVKRPYEPCELEIVLLNDDVLLASAFPTRGQYDDLGDWNPFKDGLW